MAGHALRVSRSNLANDVVKLTFDSLTAALDRFFGAMEIEKADVL